MVKLQILLLAFSLTYVSGCSGNQQAEELLQEELADDEDYADQESYGQEESMVDVDALKATDIGATQEEPVSEPLAQKIIKAPIKVTTQKATQVQPVKQASIPAGDAKVFLWVFVDRAPIQTSPYSGKTSGFVAYGQKVPVLKKINGWVKVGEDQFIRIDRLTDRKTYQTQNSKIKYVKTPDLNIRSAPNRFSDVVGRVTKGEKVVVEKKSRDTWVKIGEGRYVNGKYLVDSPTKVDWAH